MEDSFAAQSCAELVGPATDADHMGDDSISNTAHLLPNMLGALVIVDGDCKVVSANELGLSRFRTWCVPDGVGVAANHNRRNPLIDSRSAIRASLVLLRSGERRRMAHPHFPHSVLEMEVLAAEHEGKRIALLRFAAAVRAEATVGKAAQVALTTKEQEVALLVRAGFTNKQIARQLSKSIATVKMQIQSALKKLGATNRTELASRITELMSMQNEVVCPTRTPHTSI